MNIKRVKEELTNTLLAYLKKDEFGAYKIPVNRQRPIILMGPPGIGKTAIMEQVARECGVNLVSYTITHHTRQSAIGLPVIAKREYEGREYSVTGYTMSEIIHAIYEKIESTGVKEGILFIDEINCVSETLAPMMLQFLQAKTFGNHKVPDGFIIVAAGNPPEYNKSVREFDIVTLDRVRTIEVTQDFDVWKEYAYKQAIHPAIITYLDIKKDYFYVMETSVDGKRFATARGWEDLSELLLLYEELGITINEELIYQYIQHEKIAKDFLNYYDLYKKYQEDYKIIQLLDGTIEEGMVEKLEEAPFDEKLSVIGLLLGKLSEGFKVVYEKNAYVEQLFKALKKLKSRLLTPNVSITSTLSVIIEETKERFKQKKEAGALDKLGEQSYQKVIQTLEAYQKMIKEQRMKDNEEAFLAIEKLFQQDVEQRKQLIDSSKARLNHAFYFMEQTFSVGTEMVIFVTELTTNYYSMKFIAEHGNEKYDQYNQALLYHETRRTILEEIRHMKEDSI